MSLTSALSITQSVRPPRSAFLDFPLGHTAGKPNDREGQLRILRRALGALGSLDAGEVLMLEETWAADDVWKEEVMRPDPEDPEGADNRTVRHAAPQYQSDGDRAAAESQDSCPTCVFL